METFGWHPAKAFVPMWTRFKLAYERMLCYPTVSELTLIITDSL